MSELHRSYCDCLGCIRQSDRTSNLEKVIKMAEEALEKHICPDDGSIDTRCYPDNHKCSARKTLKAIKKLKLL